LKKGTKAKKAKEQEEWQRRLGLAPTACRMERSVLWIGDQREKKPLRKNSTSQNPHMKITLVVLSRK
jgi:hypothetical protein